MSKVEAKGLLEKLPILPKSLQIGANKVDLKQKI